MPIVRIDLMSDAENERADKRLGPLGDAVHQAMTETIDVPADDRFQIHTLHGSGALSYHPTYLDGNRDDDIVFITITLRAGRSDDQKKALYRRITELAAERAGVEPRNVQISLIENQSIDWSFGNGIAQLA